MYRINCFSNSGSDPRKGFILTYDGNSIEKGELFQKSAFLSLGALKSKYSKAWVAFESNPAVPAAGVTADGVYFSPTARHLETGSLASFSAPIGAEVNLDDFEVIELGAEATQRLVERKRTRSLPVQDAVLRQLAALMGKG